jgi:hypothetical protein
MMSSRRLFLAAFVCAAVVGCQDNSGQAVPAAAPPADAKILLALDYYEPVYQVDAQGRIIRLRLGWRHLPVAIMTEVGKLSELVALDLYSTTVTDEGLAQLKDLQNLKSMGLGGTPITDQGLVHLEKLPSLQWLWLSKNVVTEEAVNRLKAARPDMNVYLH